MGKKKFIDKRKSATFHLLSRDSSDPNYDQGPNGDRVFIRVDNNQFSIDPFAEEEEEHDGHEETTDSIFADAPDDDEEEGGGRERAGNRFPTGKPGDLPDNVRKEILELGFPDDGYNYLHHLREIKKTSAFYENSKAKIDQLPLDVKAYDASRIRIPRVDDNESENAKSMYHVAEKSFSVRVEKAVDSEIVGLLEDDDDMSRFGSDVEDLEEDFVVKANFTEEGEDVSVEKEEHLVGPSKLSKREQIYEDAEEDLVDEDGLPSDQLEVEERQRVRRELDEQFDMLRLKEYATDSGSDYDDFESEESESLAYKLNHAHQVKELAITEFDRNNGKYKIPREDESKDGDLEDPTPDVIRRCAEYAEMYENANDEEIVITEESSDESEMWDCETIVSTYSNLDNHPGKIGAPENTRKKKFVGTLSAISNGATPVISLRGKEKLPVDFLPHSKKSLVEKGNKENNTRVIQQKKRVGEESKEEKKERKASLKEERREARKAKKELKGLYKCEAQLAQKVAAISGPCSVHLM